MPPNQVPQRPTPKIKVLLFVHELSPTGAPKVVLSAFQQFSNAVELRTVAYLGGPLEAEFRALGPVQTLVGYRWPGVSASARGLGLFAWHQGLSVLRARLWAGPLQAWKPDVIYVNSVAGLLAARRLRLPSAPVLLQVHELDSVLAAFARHSPGLLRDLPSRYLAVSQAVADALIERFGVNKDKVSVVPAFLDPPSMPGYTPPSVPLNTPWVVGGAGVLGWVKGAELWLLMAAEVKRRLGAGKVRFVWVGVSGDDAGWQFGEMARKLHLTDDLEMVPFTRTPETYYRQFDVFALSSWEETASLALLENMLWERAVVCYAGTGGPAEFVGDAGVVVPEFSPTDMAAEVASLCLDPERRASLGQAARRRVLDNYTAARQAPPILEEIRRLAVSAPTPFQTP